MLMISVIINGRKIAWMDHSEQVLILIFFQLPTSKPAGELPAPLAPVDNSVAEPEPEPESEPEPEHDHDHDHGE